ncbi:oligopeptide transporter subunit; ATP-binding component of ABC superfamily [Microbacterium sp. C448]|uniref:ABC transporter ATP-binding protein n=1 Tax=Microbacterium TaxID=33882 RepID=UPI0003DDF68D|nr:MULTISPECIES: ABC transporter ATP-binding protein [Microbacterium]MDO8382061.1 ABC transporter ATP-binding protein [Microbacterium sp.]CDK01566.1 oligopeptide transporter subunit; ATP-binding component of ABC superfamily [Microbacterium sp. C448]
MRTLPEPTVADAATDASTADPRTVLSVENLRVTFTRGARPVHAVNGISYELKAGRMLAIIGESGSGKSVSVRALMGLLPPSAQISGSARLDGRELVGLDEKSLRGVRGEDISVVFQDPARSLNPTMSVGHQITEAIQTHHREIGKKAAAERAIELLKMVRLPAAERRFHEYPHQLSGGMRQRVMIAIALAGNPKVLIADEATTALDVTTQAQIMELLVDLQERLGTAVILISHDLGLAASYADEVHVMYAGRIVEQADTDVLFRNVQMPYTKALLGAIPQLSTPPHSLLPVIGGHPPDLSALPVGCSFRPRCPRATEQCGERPELVEAEPGHRYACWHPHLEGAK